MSTDFRPWRDALAAFAARKTRAAIAAATEPYVTVTTNPTDNWRPIATPWSVSRFGGPFYVREPGDTLPACSLVFVRSADGNTVATDPASLGGGATDYHVIYEGMSRVAADAVLAGAKTVGSGTTIFSVWHPEMIDLRRRLGLSRHPAQLVATLRGLDLNRGLLFNVPDLHVILLTEAAGAAAMEESLAVRPWIRLIVLTGRTDLPRAFRILQSDGIRRISCIGGRSLAADLLALTLVDDLYLTTSPRNGGVPGTPLPAEAVSGDIVLRKRGTGDDAGVIFEHIDLRAGRAEQQEV